MFFIKHFHNEPFIAFVKPNPIPLKGHTSGSFLSRLPQGQQTAGKVLIIIS